MKFYFENKEYNDNDDGFSPKKQPMKHQKSRDNDGRDFHKKKEDKRKRREVFERKRGGV